MESKEKFQKFAGVLQVIAKIIFWLGVVMTGLLVILTAVIQLPFSERLVNQVLQSNAAQSYLTIKGLRVTLQNFSVDEMLQTAFVIGLVGIFTMIVLLFLLSAFIRILEAVRSGMPFTDEAIRHIYRLGFGMIVYSFVETIGNGIIGTAFIQMTEIQNILPSDVEFNVDIFGVDLSILMAGLFVLLLGKIFQYGLFLQKEYDETI